jgi:hypothetical protein
MVSSEQIMSAKILATTRKHLEPISIRFLRASADALHVSLLKMFIFIDSCLVAHVIFLNQKRNPASALRSRMVVVGLIVPLVSNPTMVYVH